MEEDEDFAANEGPIYDDDNAVKNAYLNPVFTSSTPVIWLARDDAGTSKAEVQENEKEGLKASDKGAWVDGDGKVKWSVDDFEEIPIFKRGPVW